jgi:hypothetical protein
VDDVIKDLACEAAVKEIARELKRRLADIEMPEEENEDMETA